MPPADEPVDWPHWKVTEGPFLAELRYKNANNLGEDQFCLPLNTGTYRCKGAQGPNFLKAIHAIVVGDRQKDRSVDGLWPSDYAGLAVDMTFRQGK